MEKELLEQISFQHTVIVVLSITCMVLMCALGCLIVNVGFKTGRK